MQCKKMSLLYRAVCGCLVTHSHTRQEGMTGMFKAKEIENYGHPHQDGISLATVHLPQVTVLSHRPLVEVLKKAIFWNSQLPLFTTILSILPTPVLSSAKFSWTILYNWLVFFHHITWASSGTNSVTLKTKAVWSSKMAQHLSLHIAETWRQSSSVQWSWKPAHIRQVTQTAFYQVLRFMLLYDT